jgi:hypothetical protein
MSRGECNETKTEMGVPRLRGHHNDTSKTLLPSDVQ